MWIGYQALFGLGVGMGMQQPLIAAQTVCDLDDVPTATAVTNFCLTLGGALFISVGQNIFTNRLVTNLAANVPNLNPSIVLQVGATSLRQAVDPGNLAGVLSAYNGAITQAFYVSLAMACFSIIGSLGMEWKSVKGKKLEMGVYRCCVNQVFVFRDFVFGDTKRRCIATAFTQRGAYYALLSSTFLVSFLLTSA